MSKKAPLLSATGQLIAREVPVELHQDIDNSLIGHLKLPSTKGLSNGNYHLQGTGWLAGHFSSS